MCALGRGGVCVCVCLYVDLGRWIIVVTLNLVRKPHPSGIRSLLDAARFLNAFTLAFVRVTESTLQRFGRSGSGRQRRIRSVSA